MASSWRGIRRQGSHGRSSRSGITSVIVWPVSGRQPSSFRHLLLRPRSPLPALDVRQRDSRPVDTYLIPVYHRLMKCSMCPKPIPEPRRLVVPSTVTCSPECSRQRKLWLSREGAKRQRQRIKAANAAKREAAANAAEREATEQKA